MHTGPKIVKNGLIFGYDTGYPQVSTNDDSYTFNLGEPTTNVLNDNILGTGNGASLGSDDFGTYIQLANQTTSYSRFQLPSITVSSNETYTWSFELYASETFSSGYSWDTNEYSDQYPSSNDASRLTYSQDTPSTMPAGEWTPFRLTVTMIGGLTGAYTYDFFRFFYPTFQNKKIYYRNMQFERNKSHKTPYVGQGGTRSVSGSLIDLKRSNDINVTNVSYNTKALPTFDGSDDKIVINHDSSIQPTSAITLEFIVKAGSSQGNLYPRLCDKSTYLLHLSQTAPYTLALNITTSGGLRQTAVGSSLAHSEYIHVVAIYDGQNGKIYKNNSVVATNSWASSLPINNSTSNLHVGGNSDNSRAFNGEIPVFKIYDRALTAEEVKQSYNALKARFDI